MLLDWNQQRLEVWGEAATFLIQWTQCYLAMTICDGVKTDHSIPSNHLEIGQNIIMMIECNM